MPPAIEVAIVDDHPVFRRGLRQVVESDARFRLVGEAGDGPSALDLISRLEPDVAVLDLGLPGLPGLDVAARLQAMRCPARLVVLTMFKDEAMFNRALDLGVLGYVLKENAVEDLVESLLAAARGEHYLSPSISQHLAAWRRRRTALAARRPGLDDLTKAELRVLRLIADKKTSRQIAAELFVSPRTVDAHRANISAKLGLRGSHSLLHFALEHRAAL